MTRKPVFLLGVTVLCLAFLLTGISGAGVEDDYQKGRFLYLEKRFGEAALTFKDFISKYPKHPLASNALYWLGECYYDQADYVKAAEEFKRVVENYPGSTKAPDAMLKWSYSLFKLGKYKEAESRLKYVVAQYPESSAAAIVREKGPLFSSRVATSPPPKPKKIPTEPAPLLPEVKAARAVLGIIKKPERGISKKSKGRKTIKTSTGSPREIPINMADIMKAIHDRDTVKVKTIMDRHPYVVEYRDKQGKTPLHMAAALDRVDMARLLLSRDADVNADSNSYIFVYTPLHEAAKHNSSRVAKFLISRGADVNAGRYVKNRKWTDRYSYTPLFQAVRFNRLELAKMLLENGADPNISAHPSTGKTPLGVARSKGYSKLIELLMEYNAVH